MNKKKKILIFGVTGQDGSFLAKYLISKNYIVHDLKDDLGKGGDPESLKTGNAGPRLNCAKIKLI